MARVLYFDCFAGISGDMTVAALIDLGVDPVDLRAGLDKLGVEGWDIVISPGSRNGLRGTKFDVRLPHESADFHHNHHHHGTAGHPHRNLYDIETIIDDSTLNDEVKNRSKLIFTALARAEARVHGRPVGEVHFHEVGALDSIIDIVGTAICLDLLGIDDIYASPLNLGGGLVQCAHGTLPVPAPATAELLQGVPVYSTGVQAELVTPTGAAIIKTLARDFTALPRLTMEKNGYGIGSREIPDMPNMLRVILGSRSDQESYMILETNIDDMNPEFYSYLFPMLFEKGALDVFLTSIIMKKNRPGIMISILCRRSDAQVLQEILFTETTTLGVRCREVEKLELDRTQVTVNTGLGPVRVKQAYLHGEMLKSAPEYEDCRAIAEKHGMPLKEVYSIVNREIK